MKKLILLFLSFCAIQSFAQVPAISATTRWQVIDGNNIFAIAAADVVTYAQANLSGLAPTGGSTGQVLTKINGTNYNYSWQTPSSGISGSGTTAFIPKFSSSSALTNSKLFETTNTVSLGASTGIDAFTRFYVYGGSSGANVDVRGAPGAATDQAVCELQGADYSTSFKSMWMRYQGTDATGTTLGLANANLGEITFSDPDNVLIRVIPNIPMRFSINSVEQTRLDTSGWQLRSRKSLRYYDSDNTQYVELRAPSTSGLTTSYSLSLPVDDGTSGQYLKTDGGGALSWDTPSGGGGGDFLGTGFTSGGGSGNIPIGTVAELTPGGGSFIINYSSDQGSVPALTIDDSNGGIILTDPSGAQFGTDGGYVFLSSVSGVNVIANTRTVLRSNTDLAARYFGDYSADIVTDDRNIPDVGTVKLIARPYKVYTALLTQSGTDAPVATVLENTLGGDVVWTYSATGRYYATLAGAFTSDKTWWQGEGFAAGWQPDEGINSVMIRKLSSDVIIVETGGGGDRADDILLGHPIEFRVYQ